MMSFSDLHSPINQENYQTPMHNQSEAKSVYSKNHATINSKENDDNSILQSPLLSARSDMQPITTMNQNNLYAASSVYTNLRSSRDQSNENRI